MAKAKRINLALQGGGSHGAFTWGVLDRLLDEPGIEIASVSGTSAGALNGAALKGGLSAAPGKAGRDAAKRNLRHIWSEVEQLSDNRVVRWMTSVFPLPRAMQRWAEFFSPAAWLDNVTRVFSPYDYGLFYSNPLRHIIQEMPFPRVDIDAGPRFFVTATNVRTGKIRIFSGAEITADAIMASACLPNLFRAVEIRDPATGTHEAYWDGGYSGNPALFPLFHPDLPRDIVIVNINPMLREAIPKTPAAIQDRINEISFNASLLSELRAISFVKRLFAQGRIDEGAMKNVLVHMIMDDSLMNDLTARSKVTPSPGMIEVMRDAGWNAAEKFLSESGGNLGQRDSIDIPSLLS
ncbi:patatin-like phospholipase family protein [Paracoccus pacificus]|uniref:Patatin-like phospholipase family protein n=1 Tax=Paracoccus pacificus TaxID=1463598 RepID=A0ABW4R8Y0_9RHOB